MPAAPGRRGGLGFPLLERGRQRRLSALPSARVQTAPVPVIGVALERAKVAAALLPGASSLSLASLSSSRLRPRTARGTLALG